ncbi:hypothetical protein [Xanthomonas citri]|uniref:Uncharacterized protein n=1 Tax=Xanthomonas citri pv. vignicola TaxID=473426 RepID=A0AB33CR02_XANCI|nr:hypothetical protein [Xanthomonas citri]ASK93277.1 hypothetical protein XcvCFBP7111P_18795 [Xanthomonas citri pv. vignicola]
MASFSTGDGIAVAAFLLSAYATWKTYQFNEKQKGLIESQERLVIPPPISRRQKWNFLVPFPEEVP